MAYTNADLLANIRIRAMIPKSQDTYPDSVLLQLATDELRTRIATLLMSVHEEHFVTSTDYVIGTNTSFRVPDRCMKLRDVQLLPGGIATNPQSLARVQLEDLNGASGFYVQDEYVVLRGVGSPTDVLRMYWDRRPSELGPLVGVSENLAMGIPTVNPVAAVITAITSRAVSPTSDVTVTIDVAGFALTTFMGTGTTIIPLDFVRSHSNFGLIGMDALPNAPAGYTTVFANKNLPTELVVGDYMCFGGYSPVPNIKLELMPLLAQATALKVLEMNGRPERVQMAMAALERLERDALLLLSQRGGEPEKIVGGILNSRPWIF